MMRRRLRQRGGGWGCRGDNRTTEDASNNQTETEHGRGGRQTLAAMTTMDGWRDTASNDNACFAAIE